MFRKSNVLDIFGLTLVVLLLVAVMGYLLHVGFAEGCESRRRNNQIFGATFPPVEGLQENESAEPLEIEGEAKPARILLLGDSILNNGSYVAPGKSVSDWLREKVFETGCQVGLYAEDGATILDVWPQVNQIPIDENTESTALVLSVGGNDFLSGVAVDVAEETYRTLVKRIRRVFSASKLYLLNLYQPVDPLFSVYGVIVTRWNKYLKELVEESLAEGVVDVYPVITKGEDLRYRIEPSEVGGAKIAQAIVDAVGVRG